MIKQPLRFSAFLLISITSCTENKPSEQVLNIEKKVSQSEKIIQSSIEAHGGEKLFESSYTFDFRGKNYSFTQKRNSSFYELSFNQNDSILLDKLDNGKFTRTINGEIAQLDSKEIDQYSNALNSVIYFTLLPFKLNDPSVISDYKGKTKIKNNSYDVVQVSFTAAGGKDHEDEFYYWFNSKNHKMEYFAYSYNVNEGGIRFRVAKNPRKVKGVLFYDFENYKAEIGTPMEKLPSLYEKGELKLLSEIINENIKIRKALF
jgi:hypothetical protein|tara:strand:- start:40498 stop:41277 length:780 start_codon:yes stop_codon:yes gene_type:complete